MMIETLKGCLIFLGIIALLFFIFVCLELAVVIAINTFRSSTGSAEALRKTKDHDKIKQKVQEDTARKKLKKNSNDTHEPRG